MLIYIMGVNQISLLKSCKDNKHDLRSNIVYVTVLDNSFYFEIKSYCILSQLEYEVYDDYIE